VGSYNEMLRTAVKRGSARRGNSHVAFEGTRSTIGCFLHGPVEVLTGRLTCWYYSSRIFSVDFDNTRLTDFGMSGYSVSTTNNIRKWRGALAHFWNTAIPGVCVPSSALWLSPSWTTDPEQCEYSSEWHKILRINFVKRAPWLHQDAESTWWFDWSAFDEGLYTEFYSSQAFLLRDQHWRYFTYDWNERGEWAKKFLGIDAERRFKARLKRRGANGNVP